MQKRKHSSAADRIDAAKATLVSIVSFAFVLIAGGGMITVEVIAMWQFVRSFVAR